MGSVLFVGSSGGRYDDRGTGVSVEALLPAELARLEPAADWQLADVLLFFSPTMVERATAIVESRHPDVIVLFLSSLNFVFDDAVNRVRGRSRRLGGWAAHLTATLKRLAGGGADGATGPRGWLFRGPRWLARRTLGGEPLVPLPTAVQLAKDTIDAIQAAGAERLICRLATLHWRPSSMAADAERRYEEFNAAIAAHCRARGIETFDLMAALAREGRRPGLAADGVHLDGATRQFEAALLAERIVAVLAAPPRTAQ